MSDLRELYQDVILEHSKTPRNYRELPAANHKAEGFNPLCGDHFTIYLDLEDGSIRDVTFQGAGCAISKASASMMTQSVKGKSKEEAGKIFEKFHNLVTGTRKVRHVGLAHAAGRAGRQAGSGFDRMNKF
jgi:nitrogen fixation protein NifU and related proteins